MGISAVQGAIGPVGGKAVTTLPDFNFNSAGTIGGMKIGASKDGLFTLNQGDLNNDVEYTRSFTLNKTHLGHPGNLKKIRYLYFSMIGEYGKVGVSTKADDGTWRNWDRCTPWGAGGFRASVGSQETGLYWTFKFSSTEYFCVDNISLNYTVLSAGITKRL